MRVRSRSYPSRAAGVAILGADPADKGWPVLIGAASGLAAAALVMLMGPPRRWD